MRIIGALAVGFLLAGCGSTTHGGPLIAGHDKLFEAASTQSAFAIAVIDSSSQATERRLELGAPTSDWTHLYSVVSNAVIDTDPATRATLKKIPLPGDYQLPPDGVSGVPGGLSPNGKWLVLESWTTTSTTPSATHLLVLDTAAGAAPVRVELNGWFEYDAVSNDGQRLYLIEYLGGNDYRVRIYLVPSHQLDPQIVIDKSDPEESMTGVRLAGVASPDGQYLYSVYARQNKGAFVHALMLSGPEIAFCIDLPGSGYVSNPDEFRWSLVMNPQSTRLYTANAAIGVVGEISIGPNQ